MLELRWAEKGDDGLRQVVRFPQRHLDLAVYLYRHVEATRAIRPAGAIDREIDLFEVRGDATVAHYSVTDTGYTRVEMDG